MEGQIETDKDKPMSSWPRAMFSGFGFVIRTSVGQERSSLMATLMRRIWIAL